MFVGILRDLLSVTPGAVAAIFLDYEGETVAMWSERPFELSDDDLKAIGAYQGIFLSQLRGACERSEAGAPSRFKLEQPSRRTLSCDLKDGYYLVLIVESTSSEAMAWRQLERCRRRLLTEM